MLTKRSFLRNALILPFAPAIVKIENIMQIVSIEPLFWRVHFKHPNDIYYMKGINISSDRLRNLVKIYSDYELIEKSLIPKPITNKYITTVQSYYNDKQMAVGMNVSKLDQVGKMVGWADGRIGTKFILT